MIRRRLSAKDILISLAIIAGTIGTISFIVEGQVERLRRPQREKQRCLTTLKCMAQSLRMYADSYDGKMPSSYLVSRSKRWNAKDSACFCTGAGCTAWPRMTPHGKTPRSWPQLLLQNHMCPPYCMEDNQNRYAHPRVSYHYKLANDKAWYAGFKRVGDYAYESDQIAFYERLGWHYGDDKGLRNGVKINVSYMDSHVETITIKNATTGDPINCAVNSNGSPMYYNTKANEMGGIEAKQAGPATYTDPTCCYDDL